MSDQPGPDGLLAPLGITTTAEELYERALTHRSYAFEQGGLPTNERLEFLGDAVITLVVTDELFDAHPDEAEGRLAKLRAAAVRTSTLASVARDIGLGDHVMLGRGEADSGGADKDSILADTFEAVIGACYLDQGFRFTDELVRDLFSSRLAELADREAALDFKTSLQELAAAELDALPRYDVTDEGPDHDKTFTAVVLVDGRRLGRGTGSSKKRAEQRAARRAYRELTDGGAAAPRPGGGSEDTTETRPGETARGD